MNCKICDEELHLVASEEYPGTANCMNCGIPYKLDAENTCMVPEYGMEFTRSLWRLKKAVEKFSKSINKQ